MNEHQTKKLRGTGSRNETTKSGEKFVGQEVVGKKKRETSQVSHYSHRPNYILKSKSKKEKMADIGGIWKMAT